MKYCNARMVDTQPPVKGSLLCSRTMDVVVAGGADSLIGEAVAGGLVVKVPLWS